MKDLKALLFLIIFQCFNGFLFSQTADKIDAQLNCVERHYFGTSDLLVNGRNYIPVNSKAKGHPYFLSEEYQKGRLFVKNMVFEDVDIKYNLEKDQLILRQELSNSTSVQVVLTSSLVDSFRMGKHFFVYSQHVPNIPNSPVFLKKLYNGNLELYQKQVKLFHPSYTQLSPYGRYGEAEIKYYLLGKNEKVNELKNKRAFIKYYGKQSRAVKKFMKDQSIRFNKATDEQFFQLMKYCDELEN